MEVNVRHNEAERPESNLLWDTLPVYTDGLQFYLDWALANPAAPHGSFWEGPVPKHDPGNDMGLLAQNTLATCVAICLFTNKRATNQGGTNDPQGWWGDLIQLDDDRGELGSLLWTLLRGPLNPAVAQQAVAYAQESLQPLVAQGAVAKVVVTPSMDESKSTLALKVDLYSQDGTKAYSQDYSIYWAQVTRN